MEESRIIQRLPELQAKLGYTFRDTTWLKKAMCAERLPRTARDGKNNKELVNEALALVGDAIIKLVMTDHLYRKDAEPRKGKITEERSRMENSLLFHEIMEREGLLAYAYNDKHFGDDPHVPDHEKVPTKEHDPYLEAIIGAMYYDGGLEEVDKWYTRWLLPRIEQRIDRADP